MCDEELVSCSGCNNDFPPDDLTSKGLCPSCVELDTTPTSKECDHCGDPATTNICGTDLCDDCLDHYHY